MFNDSDAIFYDNRNLDNLDWTLYENGSFLKAYFEDFAENPGSYIANVQTTVFFIGIGRKLIPCTVNDEEYQNSYVCSPYTHYITYAKEELRFVSPKAVRALLELLLRGMGVISKKISMNKIVYINNYCLSTNLISPLTTAEIQAVKELLLRKFPKHQLGFRSINAVCHKEMMNSFKQEGFHLLPSRYIYISTPERLNMPTKKERKNRKQDEKCLIEEMTIVSHDQLETKDIDRIAELYHQLYIGKYSNLNPQFTAKFIEKMLKNNLLIFQGIKMNGQLEAISGTFVLSGMMTNPIYGYNLSLFPNYQLYRVLRHLNTKLALDHGFLYHQSAGAGQFKKARSGVGTPEYSALYVNHLPFYRRWFWKLLSFLLMKIGIPLVEKLEL